MNSRRSEANFGRCSGRPNLFRFAPENAQIHLADEAAFGLLTLGQPGGIVIQATPRGCIHSIEHGDILINQMLASPLAGGIHRIFLRILDINAISSVEIVGPSADSEFTATPDHLQWTGSWRGLHFTCRCSVPPNQNRWLFQISIQNHSPKNIHCDTILVQDLGLAVRGHVRNNERFTSQYLDHFSAVHAQFGPVLMTRQNLPQSDKAYKHAVNPWLIQGCQPRAAGFCTDALDFFGVGYRASQIPRALSLPAIGHTIRQHETAFTAIQSSHIVLAPQKSHEWEYFFQYSPHHPKPSSPDDLNSILPQNPPKNAEKTPPDAAPARSAPPASLFQTASLFQAADLNNSDIRTLFPGPLRHEEFDGPQRLSFFLDDDSRHVVLRAKEIIVTRPHGHILRAGQGLTPDAEVMSCAFYAAGVFGSQMALGNTVIGKFLSAAREPFNIIRSSGLRIFVRPNPSENWQLLGVPSAFEMSPVFCRWYYKSASGLLTVTCEASNDDPAFTYSIRSERHPVELLICGEISAGPQEYEFCPRLTIDSKRLRISIRPDPRSALAEQQPNIVFHAVTATPHAVSAIGGAELIQPGKPSVPLPYFAVATHPTNHFSLSFTGVFNDIYRDETLCTKYESFTGSSDSPRPNSRQSEENARSNLRISHPTSPKASQLHDAMAWMACDAIIHLSVPRGLEQANGGAWGVRDVCQGPVEFLIARGRDQDVKTILIDLFSQQYFHRQDWPQWFMFPPFQKIQSRDCHGDILIWPLKALCDYLEQTNDGSFLHKRIPYTDDETLARTHETQTVLEHVDRLLEKLRSQFLPGLSLPRYGDGDWDDSLQPACKDLADHMASSWTIALIYQTLRRYAAALDQFGHHDRANTMTSLASQISLEFQRFLIAGGVVAGFGVFDRQSPQIDHYMLHPSDARTGLRYRLISMTRGILSGIFSAEQAHHHLQLIQEHLLYPDGARLMDRPTQYRGGLETVFRRSESASFFGREIGLQYVHAHLRYAEALAAMGRPADLLHALSVINPIAVTEIVKNARLRQRNCYFSSSDAAFDDRYQASRDYDKLRDGRVAVEGGWRIYSSGPGIFTNLVIRYLFGIRQYFSFMEFDPILPREFDGICLDLPHGGRKTRYRFTRSADAPQGIVVNGRALPAAGQTESPYRAGGLRIQKADFEASLNPSDNVVDITFADRG